MTFKQITIMLGMLFSAGMAPACFADNNENAISQMEHHNMMDHINDGRISLDLSPRMRVHQLSNMRSHLEALQTIIGLMGDGDFNAASEIAHSRLGLTEEMRKMCNMFDNDDFKKLGLEFHESADSLGEILKTQDMNKSLRALQATMGYCVQCHASFRQ